ncbi:hypothetical protein [Legionella hackeliae]|uniref:Uncharacterized protein n=1 Tax=Legionella hackeliae TaxID=449 RepID=A0A0A8UX79_LEGHA|nr:hypothetical protein [Legionella hackeliae]KTD09990.1 hypothetical protein Lhac_2358 [Legionella hackeliae]CEK11707.1 conserved protein of unknown function [Legionella hackeliae]STX48476.1 Uncharacterised protein [Legionella hackeliae]
MVYIYFRSDSRPPEEIFKTGFTPRVDYDDSWWLEAIKYRGYKNNCGINNQAIDANAEACICLTTKLESAPIFPLNDEDTYLYAVILPDPTPIDYPSTIDSQMPILVKTAETPTDTKNLVIDLHSFQAKQAKNIYHFFAKHDVEHEKLTTYAGWPLYAYEAIAYQVPSSAIVGAVKCFRSALNNTIEVTCDYIDESPKKSLDRKFSLDKNIILNPHFSSAYNIWVGSHPANIMSLDLCAVKKKAVQLFEEAANKTLETPNLYYGLGGKTL